MASIYNTYFFIFLVCSAYSTSAMTFFLSIHHCRVLNQGLLTQRIYGSEIRWATPFHPTVLYISHIRGALRHIIWIIHNHNFRIFLNKFNSSNIKNINKQSTLCYSRVILINFINEDNSYLIFKNKTQYNTSFIFIRYNT